jgi:dTDP-4-dehydrorhamnose 3,5-epimerase
MNVRETSLPGVLIVEPRVFRDERGAFWESFHSARYAAAGLPGSFPQDNYSRSARGVLRGLHFQDPLPQGKLAFVLEGQVWDVAVDIRPGSKDFGRWVGVELSAANGLQLWIPPGFAHGFQVLSESALFAYKCTERYAPEADGGIRWNDPQLAIPWPVSPPVLSAKDAALPTLAEWAARRGR